MDRRQFSGRLMQHGLWALPVGLGAAGVTLPAQALSVADLTSAEATQGLRTALEKGAVAAVGLLGRPDGFLGDAKVRIPLPGYLQDGAKILRAVGQGPRLDELVTSMNRAAEQAVPLARSLLVQSVKSLTVTDAKQILTGGDTSVTQFFADRTRTPLTGQFLPVVTQVVQKVGLAKRYNELAGRAAGLGLVKPQDASIQSYVTGKALDGLYWVIGEQERALRADPVGSGSALLRKVFGALK